MTLIVLIFVAGYLAIMFEHKTSIDKSAVALLIGVLTWTVLAIISPNMDVVVAELMHHVSDIAGILFFLMGAMTIVELIDSYDGFDIITEQITTRNPLKLLWIICLLAFILSAILDNLTTAIVMVTLVRKLVKENQTRLIFVGLVVVSANAGGSWSPMGDVTTTMLWIGNQITALAVIKSLFLPSLVSMAIPVFFISRSIIKGNLPEIQKSKKNSTLISSREKATIFWIGLGGLVFVPIFKMLTHLPPFMGMLLSLGLVWTVAELIIKNKDEIQRKNYSVYNALEKIDMPSILFFLGILLAVSALQTVGFLPQMAKVLTETLKNETLIVGTIGLLSALIDNVPLVAASMGMYSLEMYPTDSSFWLLMAFAAGTGGSLLIIGSAAGVAALGLEKIDFFWYFKKITFWTFIGYLAGIGVFMLQNSVL